MPTIEELQASIAAMELKNSELLGELKIAKKQARDANGITPEQLAEAEARIDELKIANAKLVSDNKKLSTDYEASKKALEAESGFTSKLLVDNGLNDSLVKAGVKPEFLKAAKAMLKEQVQLVAEGDSRLAKVGDKALADFVKEWAAGDEGKHYVAAPENSGGGALGGGSKQAAKQITRQQLDAMPATQHAEFFKSGGTVIN